MVVRCKESETRANVRSGTGGDPVDTSDDALVDFSAAFLVWIVLWRIWDRINWDPGAIRRHVGRV